MHNVLFSGTDWCIIAWAGVLHARSTSRPRTTPLFFVLLFLGSELLEPLSCRTARRFGEKTLGIRAGKNQGYVLVGCTFNSRYSGIPGYRTYRSFCWSLPGGYPGTSRVHKHPTEPGKHLGTSRVCIPHKPIQVKNNVLIYLPARHPNLL